MINMRGALILLLNFTCCLATFRSFSLGLSTQLTLATASYTISFEYEGGLTTGYGIKLTFPSEIGVTDNPTTDCSVTVIATTAAAPVCNASSNEIIISNCFDDAPYTFTNVPITVVINSVQNPASSTTTAPITVGILNQLGTLEDSASGGDALTVTATPATMTSASISLLNDIVGATGIWQFTFTPVNPIPAGANVAITFPSWNGYIGASDLENFIATGASNSCTGVTNIETALSCSHDDSSKKLTVSGGFTSDTTGEVVFTASNIRNPPSSEAVSGFVFAIVDSSGGEYETTSGGSSISVAPGTANTLSGVSIAASTKTVSESTNLDLSISLTNPVYSGCKIEIIGPAEITYDSSLTATAVFGFSGTLSASVSSKTITITGGFTSYSESGLFLRIGPVTNAESTKPTSVFTVSTLTPSDTPIDTLATTTLTATAGAITQVTGSDFVTAAIYTVGTSTTYTFDFQTSHKVPSGGFVSIVFPGIEDLVADRSSTTNCDAVAAGLSNSAKCEVSGQLLTVHDGFNVDFLAGRITFSLSGVTNPFSAAPTDSFQIKTHPSDGLNYVVDEITAGVIFTAVPATLTSAAVTAKSSEVTGAKAKYTFRVVTTTKISVGGYLEITLPPEITISDTTNADASCTQITGFSFSSFVCESTSSSMKINGFDAGPFNPGTLEFEIDFFVNPPSTKPSTSFTIATKDSNDFKIDETSNGITVTVTTANQLQLVTLTPTSTVNGEETTYTAQLQVQNSVPTGSKVRITPPSTVVFPANPTCGGVGSVTGAVCSIVDSTSIEAVLTISATVNSGESFSFTIDLVKNPPNTQETDTFQVFTKTSDDFFIDQKTSGITVQTDTAATITDITISAGDDKIAAATEYTINYVAKNAHTAGSVIQVTIPTEFTLDTVGCTSSMLSSSLSCQKTSNVITLNNGFDTDVNAGTNIVFTLSGITNPIDSTTVTSAWNILSKIGSYLIDKSEDQTSSFTCSSECASCSPTSTTCTSCNPAGAQPFLYDDTCNATCKSGFTDVTATADKTCVACSSECKECSGVVTFCTACEPTGSRPFLYNDTCNSSCAAGSYGSGTSCLPCVNPCENCDSASICTSCAVHTGTGNQTYLDGTTCVETCPTGTTKNDSTKTCDACHVDCLTCSGSTTTCTSCPTSPTTTYLFNQTCLASCPQDGRYIVVNTNECEQCTAPCDTCQTTTSTCTSCLTDNLYEGTCITTCPTNTVQIGSKCLSCSSPCSKCTTTVTTCTECEANFYLEGSECKASCSAGFYQNGANCTVCDSNCAECVDQATKCTACNTGLYLLNEECLSSCPADLYIPETGVCTPCDVSCPTCTGTPTTCASCSTGQWLHNNECKTSCPTETTVATVDNGVNVCQDCSSRCSKCSGTIDACTECNSPYFLQVTSCVDACSSGYTLSNSICEACDSSCQTCSGSSTFCTSCPSNNYLFETTGPPATATCLTECPSGYYPLLGECEEQVNSSECSTGCTAEMQGNSTCEAACNVSACANDNGSCNVGETNCADGQYQSGSSCIDCTDPCDQCEGPSHCITCYVDSSGQKWLLFDNACYATCPDGSFKLNDTVCEACDSSCSKCQGNATTCTECDSTFLYNNQCLSSCPTGITIANGNVCDSCNVNCKTCSGSLTTCTDCNTGDVLQGTVCQSSCNSGYTVTTGNVCQQCDSTCAECTTSTSNCTSCGSGRYLHSNECLTTCPVGTYPNIDECKTCPTGCVECSSASACTVCDSSHFLYNSSCVNPCPAGYESFNGACRVIANVECAAGCTDALLNNSECNEVCNVAACNYDQTNCVFDGSCDAGKYFDGTACQDCVSPCKECESASYCTSCEDNSGVPRLLQNNTCVDSCDPGKMAIAPNCVDCDSNCTECAGSVTTCIACAAGKVLHNGSCENSCPTDTTVLVGTDCMACDINCSTCVDTIDKCTSCASDKKLQPDTCQNECDAGYTTTTASPNVCLACTGNCATCSGSTSTCLSCTGVLKLHNGVCKATCPSNVSVEISNECFDCTSPCASCSGDVTTCTACVDGFFLYQNTCLSSCPSGFEPKVGVCTALCAEGCTQALLINTDCDLACNVSACAFDNGVCTPPTSCDIGKYFDSTTSTCVTCPSDCTTCASAIFCTGCAVVNTNQLYLHNGSCLATCPDGTYLNGVVCEDCDSDCEKCETSATRCTECPTGEKLYNNTCIAACPSGTTVEINNECIDCTAPCKNCSGLPDVCTACEDGVVLNNNSCQGTCDAGKTTTPTSNSECVDCQSPCVTCSGEVSTCVSCANGVILHNNNCISTCPSGYTNTNTDPTVCTQCSSNCKECSGTINTCTVCPDGEYLTSMDTCQATAQCPTGQTTTSSSNNVCLSCEAPCVTCENETTYCLTCISGQIAASGVCENCTSPCVTCDGSKTSCTSCIEGYFLEGLECKQCDDNCKDCETASYQCTACNTGYVLDTGTSTCIQCNNDCVTCGPDAATCTTCASDRFLESGDCNECSANCLTCASSSTTCATCSDGTFLHTNSTCVACDASCKTCENSAVDCLSCDTGLTLINKRCGYCDPSCLTCLSDFSGCATCNPGEDLVNGLCGTCNSECATCVTDFNTCGSCPTGKYLQSGTCIGCDSNCTECEGSPTNCIACQSNEALISNACVACDRTCKTCDGSTSTDCLTCEDGLSLISGGCLSCTGSCQTCSGSQSTCTACFDGWFLDGSVCTACDTLCKTCDTLASNCITCPTGSSLVDNSCERECSDGKYLSNGSCIPCDSSCNTCVNSATLCTSCDPGVVKDGTCIPICPAGFYENTSGQCEACHSNCSECETVPTQCTVCPSGYRLENSTCIIICDDGQYYDGAACQLCDDNCLTCTDSATNCSSCKTEEESVNSSGKCEVPCDAGKTRTSTSGEQCVDCASQCALCDGAIDRCTQCSDGQQKLYNNLCLNNCPSNSTVDLGSTCEDCDSTCLTCITTPYTCDTCTTDKLLYANSCVASCPLGYYNVTGTCTACANVTDCPPADTLTEVSTDPEEDFEAGTVPFPVTSASVATVCFLAATKATAAGVAFMPTVISALSIEGALSWGFLGFYLPMEEDSTARRLSIIEGNASDFGLRSASLIISMALSIHVLCNVIFALSYYTSIYRKDRVFGYWRKEHKWVHRIVFFLSAIVSFHFIRMLISNFCNLNSFKAEFSDRGKLYKLLLKLGYFHFFCVCLAMVIAQVILIMHYAKSNWLWMFSIDSLLVTALLAIFLLINLVLMEHSLYDFETLRKHQVSYKSLVPVHMKEVHDILTDFPHYDFKKLAPVEFNWFAKKTQKKYISISKQPSRSTTPVRVQRKSSFPLDEHSEVDVDPVLFRRHEAPPAILDEPNSEDFFLKSRQDDTALIEIEPPVGGEFEYSELTYKPTFYKPQSPPFVELLPPVQEDEHTEIVAFTEEASEEVSVPSSDTDSMSASFGQLPPIREEDELELEKALPDPADPEVVTVHYKPMDKRVRLRKDFRGARIVDLENQVVESAAPINPDDYHVPSTVVDEGDVRFATMTSRNGKKVRVKRSFKGARIIDLEKKVNYPNAHLIGEVIRDENELHMQSAKPDPSDPEAIIVKHKPTGEDVKVKKSFHESKVVDREGTPLAGVAAIDRNNYDIPRTQVDPKDVHLATLMHKYTSAQVRVRRDFKGARIVDLEAKVRQDEPEILDFDSRNGSGWLGSTKRSRLSNFSGLSRESPEKMDGYSKSNERHSGLASVINELEKKKPMEVYSSDEESKEPRIPKQSSVTARINRGPGKLKQLEEIYMQKPKKDSQTPSGDYELPPLVPKRKLSQAGGEIIRGRKY